MPTAGQAGVRLSLVATSETPPKATRDEQLEWLFQNQYKIKKEIKPMPTVTIEPQNTIIEAAPGTLLLDVLIKAGRPAEAPCGGKGVCGRCLVALERDGETYDLVLACRYRLPEQDITVRLNERKREDGKFTALLDDIKLIDQKLLPKGAPDPLTKMVKLTVPAGVFGDGLSDYDRILREYTRVTGNKAELPLTVLQRLPDTLRAKDGNVTVYAHDGGIVDVKAGHEGRNYGLAVDIGTTTVAVELVNLENGEIAAADTDYNGQIGCGLDIISRINYTKRAGGQDELKRRITATINALSGGLARQAGITKDEITALSIAGNTTMITLLFGINPEYLRLDPYIPAVYAPPMYAAQSLSLEANPCAPVFIAPGVGSYLGGDITAGLLCTGMDTAEGVSLFMDLGTNGELVIGGADFLMGCACSAGPAFEGGGIESGMRASAGAIERVVIKRDPISCEYYTIGGGAPKGICGSGIISLIAELFRAGLIDAAGKLDRTVSSPYIDTSTRNARFILAPSNCGQNAIYITEGDIDNFIRAKAAIFSACQVMLGQVDMSFDDISTLFIAGGFGRYLNVEDARTIGLIPKLPPEKLKFIGNTSATGAYMSLVSGEHRSKVRAAAQNITYLDLSGEPGYMDRYTAALFLPHTDKELFC